MDLTDTIVPKSDQLNAEDLLAGPRTFTVKEVRRGGSSEQPVDIHLVEFPGRPFRPSKTVRRILVAAWGKEGDDYAGRRMTLYRDPDVKFGGQDVGGIRVSHLSNLPKPLTLALAVTKGKRSKYVVQPLPAEAPAKRAEGVDGVQLNAINDGLTELGITDRDAKLAAVSQVVDRELASAKDLTRAEAVKVLEWIVASTRSDVPVSDNGTAKVEDEPQIEWP